MSEQITVVRSKAYEDSMTGLENRTAYYELVAKLEEKIQKKAAGFSIAMFDINGLKRVSVRTMGYATGKFVIRT